MGDTRFHRDEDVRIGKSVHLRIGMAMCAAATIVGHPIGRPDHEGGRVYLDVYYPPGFERRNPATPVERAEPGRLGMLDTWHWPRTCPDDL